MDPPRSRHTFIDPATIRRHLYVGRDRWMERLGQLCGCLCTLVIVAIVAFFITWAVLQPHKPYFTVQDATLYALNVSLPHIISPTLQVRIILHNKNHRIGIYYDEAIVYATYHERRITYNTRLFPVYQGLGAKNYWSLFLYGNNDPLDTATGLFLVQDQELGGFTIKIKIFGSVKWRVGTYISKPYHLHVTCSTYIPSGGNFSGNGGNDITYPLSTSCAVSV